MKIKNKILLYFSATSIVLVGVMFLIVFWLYAAYREEDFQQRQKEKIFTTLRFITEIEKNEKELTEFIDQLNINSILNEKLLIFDQDKKLIYASLDDVPITYSEELLSGLTQSHDWIERKDGLYDVVAIRFSANDKIYYGISKAYDEIGYRRLDMLKLVLISTFAVFSLLSTLISIYLAGRISRPISSLAAILGRYKVGDPRVELDISTNTHEIDYLNQKFNEMIRNVDNAYAFQRHSIHHISHQLKTPIAVIVSELERIKQNLDNDTLRAEMDKQIEKTNSLAEIINTMLTISKVEAGQGFEKTALRIDELIFDCIGELNSLFPDFVFELNYNPEVPEEVRLVVQGNEMLLKQAFLNLFNNCITYSNNGRATVEIDTSEDNAIRIVVLNTGKPVAEEEQKYLFTHFFRGENSRTKLGFGLGLVLTKKIIELHNGSIFYESIPPDTNNFTLILTC
ncbi:MAG TPA: HAMP domain-containing sensor histidine kinase [Flavihumibacter sp.]